MAGWIPTRNNRVAVRRAERDRIVPAIPNRILSRLRSRRWRIVRDLHDGPCGPLCSARRPDAPGVPDIRDDEPKIPAPHPCVWIPILGSPGLGCGQNPGAVRTHPKPPIRPRPETARGLLGSSGAGIRSNGRAWSQPAGLPARSVRSRLDLLEPLGAGSPTGALRNSPPRTLIWWELDLFRSQRSSPPVG